VATQTPQTVPVATGAAQRPRLLAALAEREALIVAGAVLAGVALRAWVLATELGELDADEAVHGLMARHVLDGELSVFFWLQPYGGSQQAVLTAGAFAVFGSGVIQLKIVAIALHAVTCVLTWLLGRETVGERAARLGALLLWIWPPFLLWFTTKAFDYAIGIQSALLMLILVMRLRRDASRALALAAGLVLGFGTWAVAQAMLLVAAPALVWLAFTRPRVLRHAWLGAVGFVVGAAPWLVWNAQNDWLSLHLQPESGAQSTVWERITGLFSTILPTWFGFRMPFTLTWPAGPVLGGIVTGALLAAVVVAAVHARGRTRVLAIVVAFFPIAYAASAFAYYRDSPRYLVPLAPVLALLLARLVVTRHGAEPFVLFAAVAATTAGLVTMKHEDRFGHTDAGARIPHDIAPLLRTLERERATHVLASYWLAYRIGFESDERITATSTGFVRYVPYDRAVRSARYPARVFARGSRRERAARAGLLRGGFRRLESDGFVVYVHPPAT
jgi:4-amino-4-deoxy-L-arabinose transferase-like glycosyltransferase